MYCTDGKPFIPPRGAMLTQRSCDPRSAERRRIGIPYRRGRRAAPSRGGVGWPNGRGPELAEHGALTRPGRMGGRGSRGQPMGMPPGWAIRSEE